MKGQIMYFPKAAEITKAEKKDVIFRSPVKFPEAEGEKFSYTLGIKQDEEFPEYFTVSAGGYSFCFQKKVLPTAASDAGNEQKHYDSGYPIIAIAENQAKALWDICGKRIYSQRRRQNHNYEGPQGEEEEYLDGREINAQEFVDIRKVKEIDPFEHPEFEFKADAPQDLGKAAEKAVYDAQKKKKTK